MGGNIASEQLETFRAYFRNFSNQYILIGGTAVQLHLKNAGLSARSTKDMDIVFCVEALTLDFVTVFWQFIKEGNYMYHHKSSKEKCFYRFSNPSTNKYPSMIEIFSENFNSLHDLAPGKIVPLRVDDESVSLSAILLNKVYYNFLIKHHIVIDNMAVADFRVIIPLKANAFLDLSKRKLLGEIISQRTINKHKNDIFRLTQLLTYEPLENVPQQIKTDITDFILRIGVDDVDLRQLSVNHITLDDIKNILTFVYCL